MDQSDGNEELKENMMDVEKLEGAELAQKDLTGDSGDPYPGVTNNTNFDDKSNPPSRTYNNTPSGVVINSISTSDLQMTANMGTVVDMGTVTNGVNTPPAPRILKLFQVLKRNCNNHDPW